MIKFIKVTEERFDAVYKKMESAFPYEERRDSDGQRENFQNSHFNFFEIIDGDTPVGLISPWVFESFVFVEHLAIDSDKRSGGYGSKAIQLLKETYKKPIILEVEPPTDEQKIKRIRFYERLGFNMNGYDYFQPSFHGTDETVPLKLLSYPSPLSQGEFEDFFKLTRKEVYRQNI